MTVVKQSMSVIVSSAVGILAVAVPVLLIGFAKTSFLITTWGTAILLMIITIIMYKESLKKNILKNNLTP